MIVFSPYHMPDLSIPGWTSRSWYVGLFSTPNDIADVAQPPPVVTRPVKRKGNTLSLPGIDAKRQRNRYGRGHTAGQETGVGVIGSGVTTTTDDDDAQSSTQLLSDPNGCDGPTYTFDNYSITPTAGLDADMPPLAVEHPARVWNSLIQSLPTRIQPIIKWMYEKAHVDNIGQLELAHDWPRS